MLVAAVAITEKYHRKERKLSKKRAELLTSKSHTSRGKNLLTINH